MIMLIAVRTEANCSELKQKWCFSQSRVSHKIYYYIRRKKTQT